MACGFNSNYIPNKMKKIFLAFNDIKHIVNKIEAHDV